MSASHAASLRVSAARPSSDAERRGGAGRQAGAGGSRTIRVISRQRGEDEDRERHRRVGQGGVRTSGR